MKSVPQQAEFPETALLEILCASWSSHFSWKQRFSRHYKVSSWKKIVGWVIINIFICLIIACMFIPPDRPPLFLVVIFGGVLICACTGLLYEVIRSDRYFCHDLVLLQRIVSPEIPCFETSTIEELTSLINDRIKRIIKDVKRLQRHETENRLDIAIKLANLTKLLTVLHRFDLIDDEKIRELECEALAEENSAHHPQQYVFLNRRRN